MQWRIVVEVCCAAGAVQVREVHAAAAIWGSRHSAGPKMRGRPAAMRGAELGMLSAAGHDLPADLVHRFYWAPFAVIGAGNAAVCADGRSRDYRGSLCRGPLTRVGQRPRHDTRGIHGSSCSAEPMFRSPADNENPAAGRV